MLTTLALSVGNGRVGAHLDVSRAAVRRAGLRLGVLAIALVLPIVLILGVQATGAITGLYRLDALMHAPGAPWVDVLSAASLSALLALAIVVVARLRISFGHRDGTWRASVTLDLSVLEALALGAGVVLVALFAVHLLADGFACANGVTRAC